MGALRSIMSEERLKAMKEGLRHAALDKLHTNSTHLATRLSNLLKPHTFSGVWTFEREKTVQFTRVMPRAMHSLSMAAA